MPALERNRPKTKHVGTEMPDRNKKEALRGTRIRPERRPSLPLGAMYAYNLHFSFLGYQPGEFNTLTQLEVVDTTRTRDNTTGTDQPRE